MTATDTAELMKAIQHGDARAVRELLDADEALASARHELGLSVVMMAVYARRPDIVDILIRRGADIDIFVAAAIGDVEQIERLVQDEPRLIYAYSPDGWTPLHLAAHFGQAEAADALIAAGADVCAAARNRLRNQPLHAALAGDQPHLAELLLVHGADPSAVDEAGWTPLHHAAHAGDRKIVELLLTAGADRDIVTNAGETPQMLAERAEHADVFVLLRSHSLR